MRKSELEKTNLYVDEVERQNYKLMNRVNTKCSYMKDQLTQTAWTTQKNEMKKATL